MQQIRCAFVATYFGPYYSNFVASVLAFEDEMQAKGNKVLYVFPAEAEAFEWITMLQHKNSNVFFLTYRPHSWSNYSFFKRFFKQYSINLIYSHMCGWDIVAHFAAPRIPIIWHMHMGVNVTDRKKRIKNWIKFRVLGFGRTHHVAVSQPVVDAINSLKPKFPCVPIYNALDFDRLSTEHRPFPEKGPYNLLLFGWAPEVKGLDITLSACEKLVKSGLPVQLLVSAQEKTYRYLQERYHDTPSWLRVLAPTDQVRDLYENADIMVSASRSEGFSFSLAEAIYSGLPFVYSDIPGTNWADGFEAGYVFHCGDIDDLGRAIRTCINDGITSIQQGKNRAKLLKDYAMRNWCDQVMQMINSVMQKNERDVQ